MRCRHPPTRGPRAPPGRCGAEKEQRRPGCARHKETPQPNDCAAAVTDGKGRTFQKEKQRGSPTLATRSWTGVWGVHDPERFQRKGLPSQDTPKPHIKENPDLGAPDLPPQVSKATW